MPGRAEAQGLGKKQGQRGLAGWSSRKKKDDTSQEKARQARDVSKTERRGIRKTLDQDISTLVDDRIIAKEAAVLRLLVRMVE